MDAEEGAIRRRQRLADMLTMQGMTPDQNMTHPMSVWGKVGQSLTGALLQYKVGEQDDEYRRAKHLDALGIAGAGQQQAPAPMPSMAPDSLTSAVSGVDMQPPAQASGPYGPIIAAAAQRNNLPPELLHAGIRQESNFNPNAVGKSGERGLMQVMPSTAAQPGYGVRPVDPSKLMDVTTNINFGADYLAARGRAAGVTDWNNPEQRNRGLTAYNGGGDPNYAANVTRYLPQGGGPAPAPQPMQQPPAAAPQGMDYQAAALRALRSPYAENRSQAAAYAALAQAQATGGQRDARLDFDRQKWNEERGIRVGEGEADRALRIRLANQDINVRRELHEPRMETVRGPDGQPVLIPAKQAPGATAYIPSQEPLSPERAQQNKDARPQTTINNGQETAFDKGVGGALAEGVTQRQAAAQTGREAMEAADRIDALLQQGANTGTGANWRTGVEKAFATAGLIDGKNVSNTEQLMANMARSLLPLAANMKGSLSDKDLQFLQSANGMSITATPETIRRMSNLQRQLGQRAIEQWNPVAEAVQSGGGARAAAGVLMQPIQPPNPAAQGQPAGPPPDATAGPAVTHRFNPATGRIEPYAAR